MKDMDYEAPPRWRRIVGYEGRYAISEQGHICNVIAGRMLRTGIGTGGYARIRLAVGDGTSRLHHVHALLLEAFVGPRPTGYHTRHLDGNPANNSLSNIVWGTPAENAADRDRHGRTARGIRNGMAK